MISIGIDASTTCIGWSIFDDDNLVNCGKIKPTINDLEWRDRIQNFIPQLQLIIEEYKPQKMYAEDVPLMKQKGMKTLVQLGAIQGMLITLCGVNGIDMNFIPVSTWRKDIGLFDGTEKGKERDEMKIKSINKANDLFGLKLNCIFTKSGRYNGEKSDDDISDSILVYCSTREKYKIKIKSFGKGR